MSMSKTLKVMVKAFDSKLWFAIGLGFAGIAALMEARRRRRPIIANTMKEDYGAFISRFELLSPPPASDHHYLHSGFTSPSYGAFMSVKKEDQK